MKTGRITNVRESMKTMICAGALFFLVAGSPTVWAQEKEKILAEGDVKKVFEKKFRWGISYNQYWSTITGDNLPKNYFIKPSVGFNIRAEYYFNAYE